MPSPRIWRDEVFEVGKKFARARVTDEDGTVLTTSNIQTNIPFSVYNISAADPDTSIFSTNLVVSSTFFDTLQTWDKDSTGFNMQVPVGTNQVTLIGGNTYRLEALPLHTADGTIPVLWEWRVRTLLGV